MYVHTGEYILFFFAGFHCSLKKPVKWTLFELASSVPAGSLVFLSPHLILHIN